MKLHLPKLLRNAVLACITAVAGVATTAGTATLVGSTLLAAQAYALESSVVTTNDTKSLSEGWTAAVLVGNTATTVTYDAETGLLSGYNAANGLNVTMSTTWTTAGYLAYTNIGNDGTDNASANFGLNVTAEGNVVGRWAGNNWNADTNKVESGTLTALGDTASLTIVMSATGGTKLMNGEEALYEAGGLKSSGANTTNVRLNKDIISGITFVMEGDTTYTSNGVSVTKAQGEHVNITAGEVMFTGGESGTAAGVSAAGKPMFVGGAGLLFLQGWGTGNIELSNDIYVGGSTHGSAGTRGVIDFGNDDPAGYSTTLAGNVYVLEDTSWRSRGTGAVNITGEITDKKNVDGSASEGGKTVTIKGQVTGNVFNFSGNVSLGGLSLVGSGVTLSGATNTLDSLTTDAASSLVIADSASLAVSGAANIGNTIVNNGTVILDGLMTVNDLKNVDYEYENSSLTNSTHGFRTGLTHYYLVKGGDSASVQLGSNYALNAGGVDVDSSSCKTEGGNLIYTHDGTGTIYEIQSGCTETITYDAATGETAGATGFLMEDGTTLRLNASLAETVTSGIETTDGATVNLEVVKSGENAVVLQSSRVVTGSGSSVNLNLDGGTFQVNQNSTVTWLDSVNMTNGATFFIQNAFGSVGTEADKVAINMSGNSLISLNNGNSWVASRDLWADILINGDARIGGSSNGNVSTVKGTISGNGTLSLLQANSTNAYTIASVISDGAGSGDRLSVVVNTTNDNITLSGNNTYSGGTTITAGTLTATHANALGTGAVTVNGGALNINSNLNLSQLLTVGAGGTVTVAQNASIVVGSLSNFGAADGTLPTENGVSSVTYKIIDAAEGATLLKVTGAAVDGVVPTEAITSVTYSGREYTLTDGSISFADAYYVVKGTVGYDTVSQTSATSVNVLTNGTLSIADTAEASLGVANEGTVQLVGGTSDLASISNSGAGVVYLTNADGTNLLSFTGAFSGKTYNAAIDASDNTVVTASTAGTFDGLVTVLEGATLKGAPSFAGSTIAIAGTLNLNGALVTKNITLQEGGVLANTGGALQNMGEHQLSSLKVSGNATVNAASDITMIGSGYATVQVNIGSNTLTKTGAGVFQINNGNITGDGTIAVQEGEVRLFSHSVTQNMGTAADATFDVKGGATLRVDAGTTIGKITTTAADAASNLALGNGVTLVLGSAGESTSSIDKVSINAEQSATLDLAAGTTLEGLTTVDGGTLNLAGSGTYKQTTELTGNLQLAEDWAGKITVGEGGTLNLGTLGGTASVTVEEGGALGVSGDISCEISNTGALTATSISGKLSSTGGSLELSGDDAITSTDVSISGTELKGTWGASGLELGSGVSVGEGATITLDGATLTDTVANGGTLKLTGTTALTVEGTELENTYSAGQNGYKTTGKEYAVLTSGSLAEGSSNQWSVGGETVNKELDAAGKLVVSKTDYTTYWVQEGTVDASSITDAATTTVALNGGTLSIDSAFDTSINVTTGGIAIDTAQTLAKSQLSGEGAASLSGEGTYDLGSDLTLGDNATLADAWAGTVTSSATEVSTDTVLSLGGKVELTAGKLTLGADLTQAGELSLAATELAFSTFDACLSADTLVLGGNLTIGIDVSTLEGATGIKTTLINASTDKKLYTYVNDEYTEINAAGVAILEGIGKDGMYDAKLAWDGKALTLSTAVKEGVLVWNESESTDFGDTTEWDTTTITTEGKDVAFTGSCSDGSGTVEITGGTAKVENVIIANHGDGDAQDYTFKGESIDAAGDLSVGDGATLTVSNGMTVGGDVTVRDSSALVVDGGSLAVTTGNVNASQGTVNVTDGTLTVGGALGAVSITNAGTLEVKGAVGAVAGDVENTGTLTVTQDLSVATLDNRNELNAANVAATSITNSGTLNVSGVVKAASTTTFGLRSMPVGGEIINTGDMTVGGVDATKFTMTAGSLEITGEAGFKSGATEITGGTLKATKTDWGIDGGSIGGVTIVGDKTITLSNVKLTGALTSNGKVALSGTIDVTGLTGEDKSVYTNLDGSMSDAGNGYTALTKLYTIATGSGTTTADGVTWNTGDATAEYEYNSGLLTEKKEYSTDTYYVNADMAYTASTAADMAANQTTGITVKGGELSVNAALQDQKLTVAGGKVTLNAAVSQGITANSGSIELGSNATGEVSVSGKEVSISGGNSNVDLVLSQVTATLDGLKDTTVWAQDSGVTVDGTMSGGTLVVKQADAATGSVKLSGSDLDIIIDKDSMVMDDSTVKNIMNKGVVDLGKVSGTADVAIGTYDEKTGKFTASKGYDKYFTNLRLANGKVLADRNTSYYSDKADASVSANGAEGLAMADAVLVKLNPQAAAPKGGLAAVLNMLDTAKGEAADELGASLAGASTAVLGMATMGDVDRQLQAIRNRTTTMGVDQSVANEDMPYFNAWINAEGDRSELSESGTESGYELSSWGGTVGFDVDLCPTLTAGMALTAMYGDLDTTGADVASGNIDTYYVTAFARYAPSAWTHTFVATVGMSDISLDRKVAGAETKGETDGLSFGLMYEVGRVFALNEDGTTCLQPVFNVTWKHTTVDAYTEDGSDLALEVDEQTLDTVTFGLGARLQSVVGESMYNRTSILEARVLAKADVGDRNGSSDVALAALPGTTGSVDSAEMGTFGLEAGAGLTIPVGQEGGSVFMDASVELRSDYTNVNGTVGYRINF